MIHVVKIGSKVNVQDGKPNFRFIRRLCLDVAKQKLEGNHTILVISGAVAWGMKEYGFEKKPKNVKDLQMCAGFGQTYLTLSYQKALKEYSLKGNQVLVTYPELDNKEANIYIESGLEHCLKNNGIPLINYNDATDPSEIRKDNDELALKVALDSRANNLVLITDKQGLLDSNEELVEELENPLNFLHLCEGKNENGTGGMKSKLKIAATAQYQGITTYIAGYQNRLDEILQGKNCTIIKPVIKA